MNMLQNSPDVAAVAPQQNGLMPQGQAPQMPQQPPQISPQQIFEAHNHLSDTIQELANLIKTPDEELTPSKVYGSAADMITKHRISGGKRGASALMVAKELSDPSFPREDENGTKPSPQALRAWAQKHFDSHIITQAMLTSKFGHPQQYQPQPAPQMPPQPQPNQMMGG